jgi:phage N-6-adenine-methyltransferase
VVDKALFSSNSQEWKTPQDFFDKLNEEWKFNLDPCATPENAKCDLFYTVKNDGLKLPWYAFPAQQTIKSEWVPGRVFVNPPYGREVGQWVEKAVTEVQNGNAEVVVMLLPARTCTAWWHQWVEPNASEINFLRGRLKFGGAKNSAPFPSVVVVFKNELTWAQKLFRLPGKRREGISRESIRL